ncbi:MAG TPA: polyphosphate kinase 2 family protein [Bacteroidota bacterium]|nr:polyphosphate kinase 2 family protein [Bacteroidota bacterium]
MKYDKFLVPPGKKIALNRYDTSFTSTFSDKKDAESKLVTDIDRLAEYHDVIYADASYGVLMIVQAMDAAGKDSVIKHVMSGVNPQGCRVVSFKEPSSEELRHDYLWRCSRELPPRGFLGIFNRSYYEEVLTVRIHPEFLEKQHLPKSARGPGIWDHRFEDINHFERYLTRNGYTIVKFFLHVSKEEQKKRFLERLDEPEKNWKFSASDVRERGFWHDYQKAYEEMLSRTSTPWAPWYVIPADHKWFTRIAVADILLNNMKDLRCTYPEVGKGAKRDLANARRLLEREE